MNRFVSFGLLVAVILLTGFVFLKVMAGFFLPLFMAALLVVLFRPVHKWFLEKCKGREKAAAFLTTTTILLIVLLPFTITVFFAASEGRSVIRKLDPSSIDDKIRETRTKLSLVMPVPGDFERVTNNIDAFHEQEPANSIEEQRGQLELDVSSLRIVCRQLGESLSKEGFSLAWDETIRSPDDETQSDESVPEVPPSIHQTNFRTLALGLAEAKVMLSDGEWEDLADEDAQQNQLSLAREKFRSSIDDFYNFKTKLLGGPVRAWLKEIANPNEDEFKVYIQKATSWLRGKMVTLGGATTAFLGKFIFGVIILAIALFSFLLDGPAMLRSLKQMSPLDDQYEDELIAEFDKVSRAVVLATLLSALAQGLLAAIGYYFAGLDSVILLLLLTSVLALVPFVGAAAVWVPATLYLMFVEGNMGSGIFLGIYGAVVVSMADNIIKPFILHGQSNLHPLWALLSVLGGVSALGPVGILIGPMIVVFLQTLLKILQREIASIDNEPTPADT